MKQTRPRPTRLAIALGHVASWQQADHIRQKLHVRKQSEREYPVVVTKSFDVVLDTLKRAHHMNTVQYYVIDNTAALCHRIELNVQLKG